MRKIRIVETEAFETSNVFKFEDGDVTVVEREVHELYAMEPAVPTRLVIDSAIQSTRNFLAKSRSEIAELNSLLRELTAK